MKNFIDYENKQELIGEIVLYISGFFYSENKSRYITKIKKVTKTGFRVELKGMEKVLFDFDGDQKGLNSRMDIGIISECKLITKEEKESLIKEFKENKEKREYLKKIKIFNFKELSIESMRKIIKIIEV